MATLYNFLVNLFKALFGFCVFFGIQVKSNFIINPFLIGHFARFLISFVNKLAELFETLVDLVCVSVLNLPFNFFLQIWKVRIDFFEHPCVILELSDRDILFNYGLFLWIKGQLEQAKEFEEKLRAPLIVTQIQVGEMAEESGSGEFINFMVELILHWVQIED